MVWNWQQPDWPHFSYEELPLIGYDNRLLLGAGLLFGLLSILMMKKKTS